MKELIVKIQYFTMKQTVYIKDGRNVREERVDYRNLPQFIAECPDLSVVHIFGTEKQAKKIVQDCRVKYKINQKDIKFMCNK